jgi:hypothetical protein
MYAPGWSGATTFIGYDTVARAYESEWVFLIEYDEQLGTRLATTGPMAAILETSPFTHFWFPRRWIVPSGQYITSTPWVPDFQPRLLRTTSRASRFRPSCMNPSAYWVLPAGSRT